MISFIIFWFLFCLFSFSRQDLNLTLYDFFWWNPLRFWLQSLTNLPATGIFLILCLGLFFSYFKLLKSGFSRYWLLILPAIMAYPLFSYDLFNYLFNAKMVLIYGVNPHVKTALELGADPVLRFMHNVHTPAPYAYGWTLISLVPGLAWFSGKFTLAFWLMKVFVAIFWLGQLWILKKLVTKLFPQEFWRFWLLALNPLVLVETLINGHNDTVMIFLALLSYWFYVNSAKFKAILLLILSVSIKYVTILLLPFYWLKLKLDLPAIFAGILFLAMFTRPDQLHSWYLIWAFSFAVLVRSKWLVAGFTALTIGALLRYAPYLYFGNWDPPVYFWRNALWLVSLLFAPFLKSMFFHRSSLKKT